MMGGYNGYRYPPRIGRVVLTNNQHALLKPKKAFTNGTRRRPSVSPEAEILANYSTGMLLEVADKYFQFLEH